MPDSHIDSNAAASTSVVTSWYMYIYYVAYVQCRAWLTTVCTYTVVAVVNIWSQKELEKFYAITLPTGLCMCLHYAVPTRTTMHKSMYTCMYT